MKSRRQACGFSYSFQRWHLLFSGKQPPQVLKSAVFTVDCAREKALKL
jgi:hypothetical protein